MLFLSTPLEAATSHITKLVSLGDKRYYMVPCPHCGVFQALFFRGSLINGKYVNDDIHNVIFETDGNGILNPESVYYKCRNCSDKIKEHHKFEMMNSGYWEPTQKPIDKNFRSYMINNCYNLFSSLKNMSQEFLTAKKDPKKLQSFVNNQLGEAWEDLVKTVDHRKVYNEKRRPFDVGVVPNQMAIADKNGPILMLTCAVDVNLKNSWLGVEIVGTCLNGQEYIVSKGKIHGSWEIEGNAWEALKHIIESVFLSDDPEPVEYLLAITGIDCSFKRSEVFWFCNNNLFCVPIMGLESISGSKKHIKVDIDGNKVFKLDTRFYKIELFDHLSLPWAGRPQDQPDNFPNYPDDEFMGGFEQMGLGEKFGVKLSGDGFNEKFFKCYESEYPVIIETPNGDKVVKGFKKRTPENHFLDTRVYNKALVEIYMHIVCDTQEIERMDKWSMLADFKRFYELNKVPYLIDWFKL